MGSWSTASKKLIERVSTIAAPHETVEALRSVDEHLSLLLEHLPVILYVCKAAPDYDALYCSGSVEHVLGYKPEDFIKSSSFWISRIHPEDRPRILRELSLLFEEDYHEQEYRFRRADGAYIWVMDILRLLRSADGTASHIVGAWFDISERKRMDQELELYRKHLEELVHERTLDLKETNQRLQLEVVERMRAEADVIAEKERLNVTLQAIGDGVIATDASLQVTLINRVASFLTGVSESVALGKRLDTVLRVVNSKTRETIACIAQETADSGKAKKMTEDALLISADGTERYIAQTAAPMYDHRERLIGIALVFRDITKERLMEAELLKSQKLESVGILAGGIAHDFNNILTGIMGNISVAKALANKGKSPEERLEIAEKACIRAKDLTEQLLTFSKGGLPVKRLSSIRGLVRDTLNLVLGGTDISCEFSCAPNLWPADIDEGQIGQVIGNIALNARQAMKNGNTFSVRLSNVFVKENEQPDLLEGKYVSLEFRDEGQGIAKEHLSKIFDPYFTTKNKGTGLGLATAYSIVKNHGGKIAVQSSLGAGSCFTVYLPATEDAALEEGAAPDSQLQQGGRILLADDEELVREAASAMLSFLGYDVETVFGGEEAIARYFLAKTEGNPFDAVILDLTIPGGMGGKDAVNILLEKDPAAKVIVSSGYSHDPVMANYRDFGFCAIVTKPYNTDSLAQVLHDIVT